MGDHFWMVPGIRPGDVGLGKHGNKWYSCKVVALPKSKGEEAADSIEVTWQDWCAESETLSWYDFWPLQDAIVGDSGEGRIWDASMESDKWRQCKVSDVLPNGDLRVHYMTWEGGRSA